MGGTRKAIFARQAMQPPLHLFPSSLSQKSAHQKTGERCTEQQAEVGKLC